MTPVEETLPFSPPPLCPSKWVPKARKLNLPELVTERGRERDRETATKNDRLRSREGQIGTPLLGPLPQTQMGFLLKTEQDGPQIEGKVQAFSSQKPHTRLLVGLGKGPVTLPR